MEKIPTIYQVRNKVFCITFWNKEDAEGFVSEQPLSTGFKVEPLQVFGDMDAWLKEQQDKTEET